MIDLERLPESLRTMSWDGSVHPETVGEGALHDRANCQVFVYEVLRFFGRRVPRLSAAEFWVDDKHTQGVEQPEPLDVLLFAGTTDPSNAHFGVYLGQESVLHLCQELGHPIVWKMSEFSRRERYSVLVGIKRARALV